MQSSWVENPTAPLLYTEPFLRSAFKYPGSNFELAPAIYESSELLGFVAGFPRTVLWNAHPVHVILNTFLTASKSVKGLGFGFQLWYDLIRRCREYGYEGTINFCVDGDDMHRMMPALTRLLKLNTLLVFSIEFLVRILKPTAPQPAPDISDQDIDVFMEIANTIPASVPLVRQFSRAEAEWQC